MSGSQRSRLAIVLICAGLVGGCFQSKEAAKFEVIECAGLEFAIPRDLSYYDELRRIGTEPVNIRAMFSLAAYRGTYTVTHRRVAEVNARWESGVRTGKRLGDQGNVRRIAKYLKGCVATMMAAIGD